VEEEIKVWLLITGSFMVDAGNPRLFCNSSLWGRVCRIVCS
jgi:hypothetical protein